MDRWRLHSLCKLLFFEKMRFEEVSISSTISLKETRRIRTHTTRYPKPPIRLLCMYDTGGYRGYVVSSWGFQTCPKIIPVTKSGCFPVKHLELRGGTSLKLYCPYLIVLTLSDLISQFGHGHFSHGTLKHSAFTAMILSSMKRETIQYRVYHLSVAVSGSSSRAHGNV